MTPGVYQWGHNCFPGAGKTIVALFLPSPTIRCRPNGPRPELKRWASVGTHVRRGDKRHPTVQAVPMKPFRWSPHFAGVRRRTRPSKQSGGFRLSALLSQSRPVDCWTSWLTQTRRNTQAARSRSRVRQLRLLGTLCRRGRLFLPQDSNPEPQSNAGLFESR